MDVEELGHRLEKLERSLGGTTLAHDVKKRLHTTDENLEKLSARVQSLEERGRELYYIQEKLKSFEMHAKQMGHMVDLLYKCRKQPHIYCP